MSSGVSDQMKISGNTAKASEERNIPWSEQVDEASYENLTLPSSDDTTGLQQSSMQFQYPPFNAKENQNASWNNYKPRKPTHYDTNKKYGKPAFYNNAKREDGQGGQHNAWGSQNVRRNFSENSGNFNRASRMDNVHGGDNKLDNRHNENMSNDDKKHASSTATSAPKKTTWASIASQPAKLTTRTTLTTSSHKKKGPGMPPPPMVPGKHDLDVNTWDLPNNNPPPVPSPPPPVDLSQTSINSDFPSALGNDHEAINRADKKHTHPKGNDFQHKDDRSNYQSNSNYGRTRTSPNGHPRKNWSTPHSLHANRPPVSAGPGLMRRNEGNNGSSQHRFVDRRGGGAPGYNHYSNPRRDVESIGGAPAEFHEENSSRNVERPDDRKVESPQAVLEELRDKNNYNPLEIDLELAAAARFFVIKSYSEDDIHRSIKYEIWCSTDHGNKRLDDAFKERQAENGNVLLFFSVNGSGHFCGMAQMMTAVDYNSTSTVWAQDKWRGKFKVKWIYVKDVPNKKLRHIQLENNDNKSVTNSRDTQEVPNAQGIEVLQILHSFKHITSIFDDFYHYEERQKVEVTSKKPFGHDSNRTQSPVNRHYNRQIDDRENRDRDIRSNNGAQKYFGGGGGGGGGGNMSGSNYRDRNTRNTGYHPGMGGGAGGGGGFSSGGGNNAFNDHRRFENHRSITGNDYQARDRDIGLNTDSRDNVEYGNRHVSKLDYNKRGVGEEQMHRPPLKQNTREQRSGETDDINNGSESRYRAAPRELQKDNEHSNVERVRASDY